VGSSGMKKRRKAKTAQHGHPQHLEKVGTHSHDAAVHEQQLERDAVMDTMGLGNLGTTGKTIAWIIGAVFFACAIAALLVLIVIK
jgi:hypothetical protein